MLIHDEGLYKEKSSDDLTKARQSILNLADFLDLTLLKKSETLNALNELDSNSLLARFHLNRLISASHAPQRMPFEIS